MSIFAAAGREAGRLGTLSWILVLAGIGIWCIVVAVMLAAVHRRGTGDGTVDLTQPDHRPLIVGGLLIPGAILIALFVTSVLTIRPLSGRDEQPAVTYRIIGHQWWWDVEYAGPDSGTFRTANEIHVPLGRPVRLVLIAADVIHSFWVPQLQGKRDLMPGDTNVLAFTATEPGVFRGQCAEYCGLQHAHMGFAIVAEPAAEFAAWLANQRADAAVPAGSIDTLGIALATRGACASCHAIRGTAAHGTIGPDLTHIASRQWLGSGVLPNDLAALQAWITDPHAFKPGVAMPTFSQLPPAELHAVAFYLHGLALMPALFSPQATPRARAILAAIVASAVLVPVITMAWVRTPRARGEHVAVKQPVAFDHALHVNGVAIDCRFCHAGADRTASAGMPTTQQCVTCHRTRWLATPAFAAVRTSRATGRPIPWQRVDQLPDFVYFEHAMHVQHGVACETCHGRVDQMTSVVQVRPFTMEWCVECHRNPVRALRPRSTVTAMGWQRRASDSSGPVLMAAYRVKRLADCTTCHR